MEHGMGKGVKTTAVRYEVVAQGVEVGPQQHFQKQFQEALRDTFFNCLEFSNQFGLNVCILV